MASALEKESEALLQQLDHATKQLVGETNMLAGGEAWKGEAEHQRERAAGCMCVP